ncbi:MAG TPA: hypothetical protein VLR71_07785 [Casimicrobiaceae bacterium]|nr:hypothetical protein [Casimicrobiaceae bacterium]
MTTQRNDARDKTTGTPARDDPARSTTPQRDEALGTVPQRQPAPDAQYGDMKLPHERDESSAGEPDAVRDVNGTRAVTRQGAKDVQSGQQDTDCYNANAPRYDKREGKA